MEFLEQGMNNKNKKSVKSMLFKFIVWVPVILMYMLIFGFSDQNGEESGGLSYKVSEFIVDVADVFVDIDSGSREDIINDIQLPVRKLAHMTEYAVLSVLIYIALTVDGLKYKLCKVFSLALTFVFACSDEFHQLFVPGRCGAFSDVLIDTAGAFIAVIVCIIVRKFFSVRVST